MNKPKILLNDSTGTIKLYSDWLKDADNNLDLINGSISWQSRIVTLYGKSHSIPRLESWMGDSSSIYTYSGKTYLPVPWIPILHMIKERLNSENDCNFNGVLLNQYRNGNDVMGWHSDNEHELGNNPTIGILSLGAIRTLAFQDIENKNRKLKVELESGSLLLMRGALQHHWKHSLPKRANKGLRISCTFRKIT